MNKLISLAVALVVAVMVILIGFKTTVMLDASEHSIAAHQNETKCLEFCLSKFNTEKAVPVLTQVKKLLVAITTFTLFYVLPILTILVLIIFASKPRPSPNLIKLYLSYLK